jgi:hypothetical protein
MDTQNKSPLLMLGDTVLTGNDLKAFRYAGVFAWLASGIAGVTITVATAAELPLSSRHQSQRSQWYSSAQTSTLVMCKPVIEKKRNVTHRTDQEVRERFYSLLHEFKEDTHFLSNYAKKFSHPAYAGILGLGPQAIPLILKELQAGSGGVWFHALASISGENPVAPGHESSASMMRADWIAWGRRNGNL